MGLNNMMFNGISGINSMSSNMGVLGSNIANVNTVSYKSVHSTFYNVLTSSQERFGEMGNGSTVGPANDQTYVTRNFQQGSLEHTTRATDMAISGKGFFMVNDPQNGEILYTRDGQFNPEVREITPDGFYHLVTPAGYTLQGLALDNGEVNGNRNEDILVRRQSLPKATESVSLALNLRHDPQAPGTRSSAPGFADNLSAFNSERWQLADGWGNGGVFANDWSAEQVDFANGQMVLTLDDVGSGLVSGEYRSQENHGYGRYEVRMQASDVPGTVTGFFTYSGPEGENHEIDIEILGDDPTKMQINYWTDGVEHPVVIDLGFDASAGMHTYAFDWEPDGISWYVDGNQVHVEEGAKGPLPTNPGKLMLNLWGASGAEPWSSDFDLAASGPASIQVDRIAHRPIETAGLYSAWNGTGNPPLAAAAYEYNTAVQAYDDQGQPFDLNLYFKQTADPQIQEFILGHDPTLDRRLLGEDGSRYGDDPDLVGAGALLYGKLIFNNSGELAEMQAWQVPPDGNLIPTDRNMLAPDPATGLYSFNYNISGTGDNLTSTMDFGVAWSRQSTTSPEAAKTTVAGEEAPAINPLTSWQQVYDVRGNRVGEGDRIVFSGRNGAGEEVELEYSVDFSQRVDDLLAELEKDFDAVATLQSGRLVLESRDSGANTLTVNSIRYLDAEGNTPAENPGLAQIFGADGAGFTISPGGESEWSPLRTTNYATVSSTLHKNQDGYAKGFLESISVKPDGAIVGNYSNGQNHTQGRVLLADFINYQGLIPGSNNTFQAGADAGQLIIGTAGEGAFGQVVGNALEISNVDLGRQFADLIMTQRIFQANSKSISTADEVYQTLVRMK